MSYYQFAAVHALDGERLAEVQKATAASLRAVGAELLAFNPEMTVIPEGSDVTHLSPHPVPGQISVRGTGRKRRVQGNRRQPRQER
jgi:hypothetical protein